MKKLNCWENQKGYWEEGPAILLKVPGIDNSDRIISVEKGVDGFIFTEECDSHFKAKIPYELALLAIEELKNWIIDKQVESV